MTELQLLFSRVEDVILNAEYGSDSFLGFLNEIEAAHVSSYLKNRGVEYTFFGGYPQASRVFLSVNQYDNTPHFPITPVLISSKGNRPLTHRDYLGSLMGLGIKRECIGDIVLLSDTQAVVFVREEMFPHIERDLNKVARDSVTVSIFSGDTTTLSSSTENIRLVVSSMRIDNVLSSLINCSRSKAVDLISDDCVFCNYFQIKKPSHSVSTGDVISVRGYGKFIIGENVGKSRRDNLIINVMHYV